MILARSLTFANQATAQMVDPVTLEALPAALQALNLGPGPVLVVVGGAQGLTSNYRHQLQTLLVEVLCPFAEAHRLTVVDGGTDSGIMQLLGQARQRTHSRFPLVGVVVKAKTSLPPQPPLSADAAFLEPHHTHFLLVPGQDWGDESVWIARAADCLASSWPSATVLINGGAIALTQDVPNSLTSQRPVLAVAGSGRAADRLAAALTLGTEDAQLQSMVNSGLIHAVDLDPASPVLAQALQRIFAPACPQP